MTGRPAISAGRRVTMPASAVAAPRWVPAKWHQRVARLLCWLTYQGKNCSKSPNSRAIVVPPLCAPRVRPRTGWASAPRLSGHPDGAAEHRPNHRGTLLRHQLDIGAAAVAEAELEGDRDGLLPGELPATHAVAGGDDVVEALEVRRSERGAVTAHGHAHRVDDAIADIVERDVHLHGVASRNGVGQLTGDLRAGRAAAAEEWHHHTDERRRDDRADDKQPRPARHGHHSVPDSAERAGDATGEPAHAAKSDGGGRLVLTKDVAQGAADLTEGGVGAHGVEDRRHELAICGRGSAQPLERGGRRGLIAALTVSEQPLELFDPGALVGAEDHRRLH